jgi:hypothetical protein
MSPSWLNQPVAVDATTIDHLAHHAAGAVGSAHQVGTDAQLLGLAKGSGWPRRR